MALGRKSDYDSTVTIINTITITITITIIIGAVPNQKIQLLFLSNYSFNNTEIKEIFFSF
jgi:hypothetical protein